jgi:hypothetical protein
MWYESDYKPGGICNSFDTTHNKANNHMENQELNYRCIGEGCCGSIWTLNNPERVIKCDDGGDRGRSVLNDQKMHRKVIAAATLSGNNSVSIRIPESLTHCY